MDKKGLSFLVVLVILGASLFASHNSSKLPCANSISCIKDLTGNFTEDTSGVFHGLQVKVPTEKLISKVSAPQKVLGETSNKRIEVDLTHQRVYAFEGDNKVFDFPTSTGKWYPTPTGEFKIWIKLRYTKMEGGNPGTNTYYYLPNVPYVMFFYNKDVSKSRGFSLHGTYWHNNFGHPMSHGCVNMKTEEVAQLYTWANPSTAGNTTYETADNPGTPVIIYGEAPKE